MWQGGAPNVAAYELEIDGVPRVINALLWGTTNQAIVGVGGAAAVESATIRLHTVDPNTRYMTGEVAPAPQEKTGLV